MPPIWIPSYERTMNALRDLENRDAERRVAEALNEINAYDVWVFHSLRYPRTRAIGAAVNLEIDFLVVWKNVGFLILEVKGGRIDFDAIEGKWLCNPRNQPRKMYSRSPVEQVEGQKNDFCSDILPHYLSRQHNARNIVERVLVFPHVSLADFKDSRGQRVNRIDDFEVESIVDRERIKTLATFVKNKLEPCKRYVEQSGVLGKLFDDVVNYLRPSVCAEINPQHILENAESRIEAATEEQKEHLNHVIDVRWFLLDGPAGSAKTVLGLSAVLSWQNNGENAYFITANEYLVAGLRKDIRYSRVRDRIMTIHAFLEMALGIKVGATDSAMIKALADWEFSSKGFCIVIDEVQDLDEFLYESLVSLLPCDRLWVLRDSRQSLEKQNDDRRYDVGLLNKAPTYQLEKNCRNTRLIAEHIAKYVELPKKYINDLLPQGDKPPDVILTASLEEQDRTLIASLKQCNKDGWSKQDLVVLSCLIGGKDAVRSKYCSTKSIKTFFDLFSYGGEDDSKVAIYHSLDFRGLESPAVLVTDIQDHDSIFRANYLSGSRAKCRLILIHVEAKSAIAAREKSEIPKGFTFD